MSDYPGLRTAIAEVKSQMDDQKKSMEISRDIGKTILGASSFGLSVFSGIRILSSQINQEFSILFYLLAGGMVILYLSLGITCLRIILPAAWYQPFERDYDELGKALTGKPIDEMLAYQLEMYIKTSQANLPAILGKVKLIKLAGILLIAMIVVMIILSFFPTI